MKVFELHLLLKTERYRKNKFQGRQNTSVCIYCKHYMYMPAAGYTSHSECFSISEVVNSDVQYMMTHEKRVNVLLLFQQKEF